MSDEWRVANNERYDEMLFSANCVLYLLVTLKLITYEEWDLYAEGVNDFIERVDDTYYNDDWESKK